MRPPGVTKRAREAHDGGGFAGHVVLVAGADGSEMKPGRTPTPRPVGGALLPQTMNCTACGTGRARAGALAFVPGDDAGVMRPAIWTASCRALSWRSSMNRQKTAPGRGGACSVGGRRRSTA